MSRGLAVFGERLDVRHHRREIIVGAFETGARAMKKFGSDCHVAFSRHAVGDVANVAVDSESLLQHQHPREFPLFFRPRNIRIHRSAVGDGQSDFLRRNLRHFISPLHAIRKSAH